MFNKDFLLRLEFSQAEWANIIDTLREINSHTLANKVQFVEIYDLSHAIAGDVGSNVWECRFCHTYFDEQNQDHRCWKN